MLKDAPLPMKILTLMLLCATCAVGLVWLISKNPGFYLFLSLVFADVIVLGGYRLFLRMKNRGGGHA